MTPATTVNDEVGASEDLAWSSPTERFLRVGLPRALLVGLFLLAGVYVATQATHYGLSWDEGLQNAFGQSILKWYTSGGTDAEFTQWWPALHMQEHGPFFETVVAAAQQITHEVWLTRRVVCGLAGVLGLVGMALCGYELSAWWGSALAAIGLALYPRYTGAIFNNSKDIPFAVAAIFLLWAGMRLVRRWDGGRRSVTDSLVMGVLIGVAVAIRVSALFWYGLLVLVWAGWWLGHGRAAVRDGTWAGSLGGQARAAGVIAGSSYVTMLLCWPFLFMHPVTGLFQAFSVMSDYDWDGSLLFDGHLVGARDLPWQYVPTWLVVGSPPAVIVLGLLGAGFVLADLRRRRVEPRVLLVVGSVVVPIAAIMVLGSTLLNGLRQFLFVVPSLILLGVYGLTRLWSLLSARQPVSSSGGPSRASMGASGSWRRWAPLTVLVVVILAAQTEVVTSWLRLYPYEYTYFSPLAGGLADAGHRYEADYWRTCETEALGWTMSQPSGGAPVTIGGVVDPYDELTPETYDDQRPEYYIGSPYGSPPPDYRPVHEISRDGVVFCTVSRRPQ